MCSKNSIPSLQHPCTFAKSSLFWGPTTFPGESYHNLDNRFTYYVLKLFARDLEFWTIQKHVWRNGPYLSPVRNFLKGRLKCCHIYRSSRSLKIPYLKVSCKARGKNIFSCCIKTYSLHWEKQSLCCLYLPEHFDRFFSYTARISIFFLKREGMWNTGYSLLVSGVGSSEDMAQVLRQGGYLIFQT